MINLHELKSRAGDKEKENKAFFAKLRRRKPVWLDDRIGKIHHRVFAQTDCLVCANCCKSISPLLIDADIQRIALRLKMKPSAFYEKYLMTDSEGDYVFRETPCPFLAPDNYCIIYQDRPRACREYPHTDRKRFYQVLSLTLKNTYYCPAVFEIVEVLKKESTI